MTGNQMRKFRVKELDMTQTELAREMGFKTYRTILALEKLGNQLLLERHKVVFELVLTKHKKRNS
jgi:DNA-binding XRE family transcriptional regulator